MIHRLLLLVAAVIAAAAAVGEYTMVFKDCTEGCSAIQAYNLTTAAYCPTSSYPTCDVTKLYEHEYEPCKISCFGGRSRLVYRANSATYTSSASLTCVGGALKNAEGATLTNVQRPTCAIKNPCNHCPNVVKPDCPAGTTCSGDNVEYKEGADGCSHIQCTNSASLKLYTSTGALMDYNTKELYCTVVGKWTNYSFDGSIVGGSIINDPFSYNCVLPKACEDCVEPQSTWRDLSLLPESFRTEYTAQPITHIKRDAYCSSISCPGDYVLHGFSGTSSGVTGLEYTSRGYLKCDGNSRWTNGGYESSPNNLLVTCLMKKPPTTTAPPTTTVNPCGAYNQIATDGGASVVCNNGQNKVECPDHKKIEILTSMHDVLQFEHMTFVAGKGWLAFDCSGGPKLFKNSADIVGVNCSSLEL